MYTAHRIHDHHKILHFVRHAEGHHNIAGRKDPVNGYLREDLMDAEITENGIDQCRQLMKSSRERVKSVQLVLLSPMNRTIQTGLHSFPHLQNIVPWIALDEIREQTGSHPCDRRQPIHHYRLQHSFIDFDHVRSDEDEMYSRYQEEREPLDDVITRATAFLSWVKQRPEREILVITHSAFLRHLFNYVLKVPNMNETEHFQNCEMRSFVLPLED